MGLAGAYCRIHIVEFCSSRSTPEFMSPPLSPKMMSLDASWHTKRPVSHQPLHPRFTIPPTVIHQHLSHKTDESNNNFPTTMNSTDLAAAVANAIANTPWRPNGDSWIRIAFESTTLIMAGAQLWLTWSRGPPVQVQRKYPIPV